MQNNSGDIALACSALDGDFVITFVLASSVVFHSSIELI